MSRQPDRRTFLKSAAAASAAFTILRPEIVFGTAANSSVGLGVIGCGNRGTNVGSGLVTNAGARITAVADLMRDKLADGQKNFNQANRGKGYTEISPKNLFSGSEAYLRLIECKDVDAVLVTTPAVFHPMHMEAAVEAGKHTYCEKPVGVDVKGVNRFLRASDRANGRCSLAVGFQIRHATPYVELRQKINEGLIGDIVSVQAYYFSGEPDLDWRADRSWDENRLRCWFWFRDLSGDILVEQGIHVVDICNWILGQHPVAASGVGGRAGRDDKGDAWSHYQVNFEYPCGAHVNFHSTQLDPAYGDVAEKFFGTKGIAEAHYSGGVFIKGAQEWDSGASRGGATESTKDKAAGRFSSALEDADPNKQKAFIGSITSGQLINEGRAGADTAMSAILGRTAAYWGRRVTWDEVAASDDCFEPALDLRQFDK